MLALSVGAAAWADCVGEQNARAQMKCCAAMHHQCGKDNPDDCCNEMKDAGPSSSLSTTPIAKVSVPVTLGVVQVLATAYVRQLLDAASIEPAFIRPHDPPHLHTFPLLI